MSKAEDLLKRQTLISQVSGSTRVAKWLMVLGSLMLTVGTFSAWHNGESILRAVLGPSLIIALGLRMKITADRRSRELEQGLA